MSDGQLLPGFLVGHASDEVGATGVTAILCPEGAVPGVDVRGAAPGTRETDLIRPENLVDRVHGLVFAGGSAFGLAAADGAVRWLAEQDIGWPTLGGKVPIVVSAILYDLNIGEPGRRPDAEMGYAACSGAESAIPVRGSVGAGTGATIAKTLGMEKALKGGLGFAEDGLASGLRVQAFAAVNASGAICDSRIGELVGGPRGGAPGEMLDPIDLLRSGEALAAMGQVGENTTLAAVLTNAVLSKQEATRLAMMAQAGMARAINPVYALSDGDVVFTLAHGDQGLALGELTSLGAIAAAAVERAILDAVRSATSLAGVPSVTEWLGQGRAGSS
ncbi:MAG: P1 family peptidase [Dehalococcoidia bacterium]